jgi:hypothetical protein
MTQVESQFYVAAAIVIIFGALWLWMLSRRGWVFTMVLVGLALVANLYFWFIGEPHWIRMTVQAFSAFYLNSAPVRELFLTEPTVTRLDVGGTEKA